LGADATSAWGYAMKRSLEGAVSHPSRAAFALAALVAALIGLPSSAPAQAPAPFRVCAQLPWRPPSLELQRAHLGRNPRWSPGDRADPSALLDFPFYVRVASGSISYDQRNLYGLWNLSERSYNRIYDRCGQAGGRSRRFIVALKAWSAESAALEDDGGIVIDGHPTGAGVQMLLFPGYGTRSGFANRRVTLRRTDSTGCAISGIGDEPGPSYSNIESTGADCAETLLVVQAFASAGNTDTDAAGYGCVTGLEGYYGRQVRCVSQTDPGRLVRFQYAPTSDEPA
jgi:hypothetical protein